MATKVAKRSKGDPAIAARIKRERRQYKPFAYPTDTKTPAKKGKRKPEPTKAVRKVGNERLVERPGVREYKENPYVFGKDAPEFVSQSTLYRAAYRALKNKDMKTFRSLASEKNFDMSLLQQPFSYAFWECPAAAVYCSGDKKLIDEYLKELPKLEKIEREIFHEPNLLQRRTTGSRNFHMLGRATRQVQVSRGGREGNNALVDYETFPDNQRHNQAYSDIEIRALLSGLDYPTMDKLKNGKTTFELTSEMMVEMVRFGKRQAASDLIKLNHNWDVNELHKMTLEGGKLPDRILNISIKKKAQDNRAITPLHTAAINPDANYLKKLHAIEPNISITDIDNWTVAHYAAVCEGNGPLDYLITLNTPLVVMNKKEETPLHCAARAGRLNTVKTLLNWYANYEKQSAKTSGQTDEVDTDATATASKKAKALKTAQAKSVINYKDRRGYTALHLAVLWGHVDVVRHLLQHPKLDIEAQTSAGDKKLNALIIACGTGQLDMVKLLVEDGKALIESKDKLRRSPLLHAALNGQDHILSYLLKKGADMHKPDSSGNSPAHYAAAYGFLSTLQVLAEVDATCLSAKNDWQLTPLSVAYMKGHYGIVTWLLNGPYSANDNEGVTLIASLLSYYDEHFAQRLPEQIQFLTEKGADCSIPDGSGTTPMHIFATLKIPLCEKVTKKEVTRISIDQYRACIDRLLAAGGAVTAQHNEGATPFNIALASGNLILAEYLLSKAADLKSLLANDKVNLLELLIDIPLKIFGDKSCWPNDKSPLPGQYKIGPLLKQLISEVPAEIEKWIHHKFEDNTGTVINRLATKYLQTIVKEKSPENGALAKQMCAVLIDALRQLLAFKPDALIQTDAENLGPVPSLIHQTVSCHEKGELLELLLTSAIGQNRLEELLSIRDSELRTPLQKAIHLQDAKCVTRLLDVTKKEKCSAAVHNAIFQTWVEIDGQRISLAKTVLHLLVEAEMIEAFDHLDLDEAGWTATDRDTSMVLASHQENGDSGYHYACRKLNGKTITLLQKLRLPKQIGFGGRSPLHVAVDAERTYSADAFTEPIQYIAKNVDVNHRDNWGRTALHYAFMKLAGENPERCDPIAVVSLLLQKMNPEAIRCADRDGNTALHLAALRDANICAVTLIHHGSPVDGMNNEGNTPLGIALLRKWSQTALTLIQSKADIHKDVYGPVPEKPTTDVWAWITENKRPGVQLVINVPGMVVRNEWHSMVYVILDLLEKSPTTVGELATAALRNGQHNFAQYLLKLLESAIHEYQNKQNGPDFPLTQLLRAYVDGLGAFGQHPERVLNILLDFGIPWVTTDGDSEVVEILCKRGMWNVVEFLKRSHNGPQQWTRLSETTRAKALAGLIEYWIKQCPTPEIKAGIRTLGTERTFQHPTEYPKVALQGLPLTRDPPELEICTPMVRAIEAQKADLIVFLTQEAGCPLPPEALLLAVRTNQRQVVKAVCDGVVEKKAQQQEDTPMPSVFDASRFLPAITHNRKRAPATIPLFGFSKRQKADASDEEMDDESNSDESASEDEPEQEPQTAKKLAKLALKMKNKVKLDYIDAKHRNIFHYMVYPIGWENEELLQALYNTDKSKSLGLLKQKDIDGNTPLDLAAVGKQRKMYRAMAKLAGTTKNLSNTTPSSNKFEALKSSLNYDQDATDFLAKHWAQEEENKTKAERERPHPKSGYEKTGEIVYDDEAGQLYKVLLNKTDLQYGTFGFHNYYRMELLKRKDTDLYVLFTHWGRIGDPTGEFQCTPFSDLPKAAKEFKSVFRQKCGQDWGPLAQFQDLDKKYRLVEASPKAVVRLHKLPITLNTQTSGDQVYEFLRDITQVKSLANYMKQVCVGNVGSQSPLGGLSSEKVEKAREVLKEIVSLNEHINKLREDPNPDHDKLLTSLTQQRVLSSQFFTHIPLGGFEQTAVPIICDDETVKRCEQALVRLDEVEIATRLLCAASLRHLEWDSLRYVENAMECRLTPLTPQDHIAQRILQYIRQSMKAKVRGILIIESRQPGQLYAKHSDEEGQIYLWHGTKAVNLVSILKNGFHSEPSNALRCGQAYGKGVYFADSFAKSASYTHASSTGVQYTLLCKVAPGKIQKGTDFLFDHPRQFDFDTRFVAGTKGPDPSQSINFDGVVLPCGAHVAQKSESHWGAEWSEYIVRDTARTLPAFVIMWSS
ncbi:unnamed protein product, partial [Mesorhabditis spiculigera]